MYFNSRCQPPWSAILKMSAIFKNPFLTICNKLKLKLKLNMYLFNPFFFFYIYIKCNFISDIKQNNIGLGDMH